MRRARRCRWRGPPCSDSRRFPLPFPQVFAGQVLTADVVNATRKRLVVQTADQVLTNQATDVDTEIIIPVEAGAVYWFECLISYSAVSAANSALMWSWDAPTGTALARFTQSYVAQPLLGRTRGRRSSSGVRRTRRAFRQVVRMRRRRRRTSTQPMTGARSRLAACPGMWCGGYGRPGPGRRTERSCVGGPSRAAATDGSS